MDFSTIRANCAKKAPAKLLDFSNEMCQCKTDPEFSICLLFLFNVMLFYKIFCSHFYQFAFL
jgi:hypothetical protein